MPDASYRIRPDLLIYSRDGELLAEQLLTGEQAQVNRDTLALLVAHRDGMTAAQLHAELTSRGYDIAEEEVSSAVETLESAGILSSDLRTETTIWRPGWPVIGYGAAGGVPQPGVSTGLLATGD